jgi:hypothetical protein
LRARQAASRDSTGAARIAPAGGESHRRIAALALCAVFCWI